MKKIGKKRKVFIDNCIQLQAITKLKWSNHIVFNMQNRQNYFDFSISATMSL